MALTDGVLFLGFWHCTTERYRVCRNFNQEKQSTLRLSILNNLEALLLNTSGNVPLHNCFRALFTLKALKSDEAVIIISKGYLLNASN